MVKVLAAIDFFWNKIISRLSGYISSLVVVHFLPGLIGVKKWWHVLPFTDSPMVSVDERTYYIIVFVVMGLIGFLSMELIKLIIKQFTELTKWLVVKKQNKK